jgi:DNA-binding Lrp family transcriptional regulator
MTEHQPLDGIDLKILSELQQDGRIRINELASRIGLSLPPCLRRVRSLLARGVIKAIRATLDEKALGYEVVSFVSIQLTSQARATLETFEASIAALPLVLQSWRISGEADFYSNASHLMSRGCIGRSGSLRRCPRSAPSEACRCWASPRMRPCRYRGRRPQAVLSASKARRAGRRNCRHRRPGAAWNPSARSPGRQCPCARNRPPHLPCCRSAA